MSRAVAEPPIDEASLRHRTGGDDGLALELLRIFRDEVMDDAMRLLGEPDPVRRGDLAHRVRGAALAIGADRLAGLAEMAGMEGEADSLRDALLALAAAIDARLGQRGEEAAA